MGAVLVFTSALDPGGKLDLYCENECLGLLHQLLRITWFDRFAVVVGHEASFLRALEQTAHFLCNEPALDQVLAEALSRPRWVFAMSVPTGASDASRAARAASNMA